MHRKKYFDLVVDLLELEDVDLLSSLADEIQVAVEKQQSLLIVHRFFYLLEAWRRFLLEELSLEEFVQIGDIASSIPLLQGRRSPQEFLYALKEGASLPQEEVCVLDALAWDFFLTAEEKETIQTRFEQEKKHLILK